MKANELMIGDWVQDRSGAKIKIVNIEYHCTRVLLNGEELILACFEQANLMPIPLTPEILEKNGFSDNYAYDDLSYAAGATGNIIGVHILGEGGIMDEMYFKYVHQLQHALRLCGIEKEIIL